LIYFQESFEEKRKGKQDGHISKESLGTFPKEKIYLKVVIYCCVGCRTIRIRIGHTIERRARFSRLFVGTYIDVVLSIPCYRKGSYRLGRTIYWGHIFWGVILWVGHTKIWTWHDFQGRFLEGQFGCCKWFYFGCKCNLVANI